MWRPEPQTRRGAPNEVRKNKAARPWAKHPGQLVQIRIIQTPSICSKMLRLVRLSPHNGQVRPKTRPFRQPKGARQAPNCQKADRGAIEKYVSELTAHPIQDMPPQKGRHTNFFISFSVASTRRLNAGAQGGGIPLPRATLRSREREGKVFPRPALRSPRSYRR